MRLRNVKIDESIKRQFKKALEDEHTVIDPTTADALQNEEDVKKQIEKEFKENDKAAEEVAKATAGDQAVKVKDRKELTKLLSENKNRKAKISRCLEEGFRYLVEWVEPLNEELDQEDEKKPLEEDADGRFGYYGNETVVSYKEFLNDALDVLENYNDDEKIRLHPNTYGISVPFIGTYGGYIEINNPVEEQEEYDDEENESLKEAKDDEPKLETFDEQMDYLAADEQEAIDGYNKVLALVEDEHVKEQLQHILDEEVAHKEFLEAVKADKTLTYSHNDEEQEPAPVEETETEVIVDESLNEGKSNWDKIQDLFKQLDNGESTDESLDEEKLDEKNEYSKKSDDKEQALQIMTCNIYSKYSNEYRDTIYRLVANLKSDFPDKSDDEIQEIAEKAIVEETADDYLDTGDADYLFGKEEESLDEAKKDKRGKGTVGLAIEKNREKLDKLAFKNKTEMVKALSKILEDKAIEDKAYAKEVLRNATKKKTSADILAYLYDIMLKQIGLGSPDAKEEPKEEPAPVEETEVESLNEEVEVELNPAQKALLDNIRAKKANDWYDEYEDAKTIAINEWINSNIEIPAEWCQGEENCDYENVNPEHETKYFEEVVYQEPFISELNKVLGK